ncbi:MAG TPA: phosphoribosylanthranilate isomerase [Phycisphaerae bacterium]|nr:phosphoribosylanthranilate isomerase [Phycisphaerae bacterium]
MVRIKICGITTPEDAILAVESGADAIGLVFARSPRQVTVRQARQIVAALPPFFPAVGVFVNARAATVLRTVADVGLSAVQLHGDESADYPAKLGGIRTIKALRVRDRAFVEQVRAFREAGVSAILLDAFSPKARGGSGKRFDWDLVVGARDAGALENAPSLILAGGLTSENVAAGIRRLHPWGVDVSSGVEESPGVKSAEKIVRFIAAARSASSRA